MAYYEASSNYDLYLENKVFTLSIILSPILRQYISGLPGINLADVFLGISSMFLMFRYRFSLCLKKTLPLLLFWFFGLLVSLLSFLLQQELVLFNTSRFARYTFYVYVLVLSARHFQLGFGLRILKLLTLVISLYIIAQWAAYNVIGILLPFKVLPFAISRDISVEAILSIASRYYFRPLGVFVEPGYAAHFLLPGLTFFLFGYPEKNAHNIWAVILVLVAIFLTTSSQGIVLAVLVIIVYILWKIRSVIEQADLLKVLFVVIILATLLALLLSLNSLQMALRSRLVLPSEVRAGSSASLRLYRGFAVYSELPSLFKIVGVGHGNLDTFVVRRGLVTEYDRELQNEDNTAVGSTNGISAVLLYYGVFGVILFVFLVMQLFRHTGGVFRTILFIFVALNFIAGALFGIVMVFYMALIYAGFDSHRIKNFDSVNNTENSV